MKQAIEWGLGALQMDLWRGPAYVRSNAIVVTKHINDLGRAPTRAYGLLGADFGGWARVIQHRPPRAPLPPGIAPFLSATAVIDVRARLHDVNASPEVELRIVRSRERVAERRLWTLGVEDGQLYVTEERRLPIDDAVVMLLTILRGDTLRAREAASPF